MKVSSDVKVEYSIIGEICEDCEKAAEWKTERDGDFVYLCEVHYKENSVPVYVK